MEEKKQVLKFTILALAVVIAVALFLQIINRDISRCRYIFAGLTKGSYAVEKLIDWENLKALKIDVGAVYRHIPNQKEKTGYKQAFIQNFSVGFKRAGGKANLFTHWRAHQRDREKIIVAADYSGYNKTILFTLSKLSAGKLVSIQWK